MTKTSKIQYNTIQYNTISGRKSSKMKFEDLFKGKITSTHDDI